MGDITLFSWNLVFGDNKVDVFSELIVLSVSKANRVFHEINRKRSLREFHGKTFQQFLSLSISWSFTRQQEKLENQSIDWFSLFFFLEDRNLKKRDLESDRKNHGKGWMVCTWLLCLLCLYSIPEFHTQSSQSITLRKRRERQVKRVKWRESNGKKAQVNNMNIRPYSLNGRRGLFLSWYRLTKLIL